MYKGLIVVGMINFFVLVMGLIGHYGVSKENESFPALIFLSGINILLCVLGSLLES